MNPTDMDVDPEDSLLIEHEHMTERTDADFFNGDSCARYRTHTATRLTRDARLCADFPDDFDDDDLA